MFVIYLSLLVEKCKMFHIYHENDVIVYSESLYTAVIISSKTKCYYMKLFTYNWRVSLNLTLKQMIASWPLSNCADVTLRQTEQCRKYAACLKLSVFSHREVSGLWEHVQQVRLGSKSVRIRCMIMIEHCYGSKNEGAKPFWH